jgi:hypothetical protein
MARNRKSRRTVRHKARRRENLKKQIVMLEKRAERIIKKLEDDSIDFDAGIRMVNETNIKLQVRRNQLDALHGNSPLFETRTLPERYFTRNNSY